MIFQGKAAPDGGLVQWLHVGFNQRS